LQIEKQRYQFWCKNGGKMVYYAGDGKKEVQILAYARARD